MRDAFPGEGSPRLSPEEIVQKGLVLVDEPHPDGGLGLRVWGLPDGSIAVRARSDDGEAFFVVGPQGAQRLTDALAFWRGAAQVMSVPEPEAAPNDE